MGSYYGAELSEFIGTNLLPQLCTLQRRWFNRTDIHKWQANRSAA